MKYNYEKETIRGVEYKYSAEWIYDLESEEHWRLYWNQQKLMQNKVSSGDNVLEIGVGSGFTANYLKSKSINVKTLDIDRGKKPDIVANLVEYQFHTCRRACSGKSPYPDSACRSWPTVF